VNGGSILCSLNVKTARWWRGTVAFTHLAREGRMTVTIGRRELLAALGGAAVAWPLAARAQQTQRVRCVGVLFGWSRSDPRNRAHLTAFVAGLAERGWRDGVSLRIEERWTEGNRDRARLLAKELVELQPDVILASTTPVTAALMSETHEIPIVFVVVSDPVGAGFVASLSQPGGNVTGFINIEAAMGGKWLSLVKEMAPRINRAGLLFNPDTAPGGGKYFMPSFEAAARTWKIEPINLPVRSDAEIENAIGELSHDGGLVVMTDSFMIVHRGTIISSMLRNKVPTIMDFDAFVREGGLMSYGPRYEDIFPLAAGYVDRILKGEKPADLPVQVPPTWDLVINLKTAKALGVTVPATLLAIADEVIE
jgi:putative ABC transport system substrate-binding protein